MDYAYKAKQIGPIIYGLSIGDKLKLTGSATVEATAEIENAENGIATWKAVSFNASGESYVTAQNAAVRVTATTDCTLTVTEGTERELTEYRIGSDVTSPGKSVSSVVDPVTGVVRLSDGNIPGLVALGSQAPLTPVTTVLASDVPTITNNATATISGGRSIGRNDPALTYYSNATLGEFQSWLTYNNGSLTQIEFCTNSQAFEFGIIRYNTQMRFFVDSVPVSAAISNDSAGSTIYYKLAFSARKNRRITVCGINMPFNEMILSAGDAIWSAPDDKPIMCVMGDSYTFGNGGTGGPAFSWAMLFAQALGYRCIPDAVGGTGWTTTGATSALTRLNTVGANALVKRIAGVNYPLDVRRHVAAYGYNDAGGDMAVVQAAAKAYADASKVKPLFIGPWTPLGVTANLTAVETALKAAAQASNCQFVPINDLVTADNKASLTDVDNVHPANPLAHEFLALSIGQRVRAKALA